MGRRQTPLDPVEAIAEPSSDLVRTVAKAAAAAALGLGAALCAYVLFSRRGIDKIKEWIPKVTVTREQDVVLTDVHRNGHSKAKLGGLGRLS